MTTNPDKVQAFIDAVKSALPEKADYIDLENVKTLETELKKFVTPESLATLNDRNINGAAGVLAKHVISAAKEHNEKGTVTNITDIAKDAADGLIARSNHKSLMTSGKVDEAIKSTFDQALEGKSDLVKNMEKSYDQMGKGFGGQAVRYGTAAVGAFLVYNRFKALFKKKEVVNEQTGEVEQKNPSFWSRLGNLLLATGIGVVTYKVGFQNKTFGQVGEDVSNTWQKYVTNRSQKAVLGSFRTT